MKYYKVTTKNMESSYTKDVRFRIKYSWKGWITPKIEGCPIFVFNNIRFARQQAKIMGGGQKIYEAKVRNPRGCPYLYNLDDTINIIQGFFKSGNRLEYKNWSYAPSGTIACDAIKLVKRIK